MSTERKSQLSELMRNAWRICRVTGKSFAECLKKAWMVLKLKATMKTQIVQFFFMKQNGEMRQAFGTTDTNRFEYTPTGNGRKGDFSDCIQYWDTVKGGFRMFKIYNLVSIAE